MYITIIFHCKNIEEKKSDLTYNLLLLDRKKIEITSVETRNIKQVIKTFPQIFPVSFPILYRKCKKEVSNRNPLLNTQKKKIYNAVDYCLCVFSVKCLINK